ncbi:hypothetical protein, partial [Escherichia coli]|uniref:hypothetical protein n=1 Tax=Escherichia coli TaxID=562 RepID=UPI001BFE25C7
NLMRSASVGVLRQEWPGDWRVGDVLGVRAGLARLARVLAGEGEDVSSAAASPAPTPAPAPAVAAAPAAAPAPTPTPAPAPAQ